MRLTKAIFALATWLLVYTALAPISKWITYGVLGMVTGGRFASAVEFFLYEAPKVLMLLVIVVGIVRSFFTPERTRRILAG